MSNPYLIEGPALISFSGGRTSAYMLYKILEAHGGVLPAGVRAVFANTGKEREETLRFVHECGVRWNVDIVWLEWRPVDVEPMRFVEVGYNSANRDGHWFARLIDAHNVLPNSQVRYCTKDLKIRTMARYMRHVNGSRDYLNVVGLRADEEHRVLKLHANQEHKRSAAPMHAAGATKADVMAFWAAQPFDLQLRNYEGNCDLCFLKKRAVLRRIIREGEGRADWWVEQEQKKPQREDGACGNLFRDNVPFASIRRDAVEQPLFPIFDELEEDDYDVECGLTCGEEEQTPEETAAAADRLIAFMREQEGMDAA